MHTHCSVCEFAFFQDRVVIVFITMCNLSEDSYNNVTNQVNETFKTLENRSVLRRIALLFDSFVMVSAPRSHNTIYKLKTNKCAVFTLLQT